MSPFKKLLFQSLVALLALLFIFLAFSLTPPGKIFVKLLLLLPAILPNAPVNPLTWTTAEPISEEIGINSQSQLVKTTIFRPNDNKKRPTAIFTMYGIDPSSDLVSNYAKTFARLGFVVAIPKTEDLIKANLKVEQVDQLVDIFDFLSLKGFVDERKIGFIGMCAGGSYALVAAANSKISQKVKFIVAVSPYFDVFTTYNQVYSKVISENGRISDWSPSPITLQATNGVLLNSLANVEERKVLEKIIIGEIPESESEKISESGQKIYNFIKKANSDNFLTLWGELPEVSKKTLAKISPSNFIKNVKTRVFILSDGRDILVPSTESENLAKNLSSQAEFVELDLLEHTQFLRKLPRLHAVRQILKLAFFVYKTLYFIS